jgi:predicted KAP-like P-loop ATPase
MTNNNDQPINKYENDLLGRQNFVKNLAKSIKKYSGKDSFVIGLYGEWGTGKTSIINQKC